MGSAARTPGCNGEGGDGTASAPFHVVLRAAIHERGLTLESLHRRLDELGARVSVATLSNWQRGLSRPDRARSERAVLALEEVLGLSPRRLARLLGERRARGPRRPSEHDTSLWAIEQVRSELDAPFENPFDSVVVTEELVIGPHPGQWELHIQVVSRARENNLDTWVYYYTEEDGALPTVRGGPLSPLNRMVTDEALNTVAAEFTLSRPLTRGELYPLDFHLSCPAGGAVPNYHGRWVSSGCAALSITVRFEGDYRPAAAYEITQRDQTAPIVDVAQLPLIDGRGVHVTRLDPEIGLRGIRWNWA